MPQGKFVRLEKMEIIQGKFIPKIEGDKIVLNRIDAKIFRNMVRNCKPADPDPQLKKIEINAITF